MAYLGQLSCAAQFSYDAMVDQVALVNVPGNVSEVQAAGAGTYIVGDWYAIEVKPGFAVDGWYDNSVGPKLDAQFDFRPQLPETSTFQVLDETALGAWCKQDGIT